MIGQQFIRESHESVKGLSSFVVVREPHQFGVKAW
jgi:hypothetical protein